MALVSSLTEVTKDAHRLHDPIQCTFSIITDEVGRPVLQLDTRGRSHRMNPEKVSQSLQFDEVSGRALKAILEKLFPG